jgi:hypothetical protein
MMENCILECLNVVVEEDVKSGLGWSMHKTNASNV